MHADLVIQHWQWFLDGYMVTLILLVTVFSISMLLAILLAVFRSSDVSRLSGPIRGYTYFMRGTPLLLQVYIIYYGLGQFEMVRTSIFWPWLKEAWFCIAFGLILNNTAYLTEIIQGVAGCSEGINRVCSSTWHVSYKDISIGVVPHCT